jgi:hypothetical protein
MAKKKRKSASDDWGYPAFAEAFPRSPELDALVQAFARGDYAHVRREAPALAAKSEDAAVRDAATTLVRRTEADPLAKALFVLTALLLVGLSVYWVLHDGPQGR